MARPSTPHAPRASAPATATSPGNAPSPVKPWRAPPGHRRSSGLGLGDERVGDEPLAEVSAACPFCGASGSLLVDISGGRVQSYVEDCEVCCRPRTVHVTFEDDGPVVHVSRDD